MARTTKEKLAQLDASEKKNRENVQAYVDAQERDARVWMIEHFEARLVELMAKGAHRTHPWITERYEADLNSLYRVYRG